MKYKMCCVIFSLILAGCSHYYTNPANWQLVSNEKSFGISGIAVIDPAHFLVVHDNKKNDEPRLSQVTWYKDTPPRLAKMAWCKAPFPVDVEAIAALPGNGAVFLILESQGRLTRIRLEKTYCDVMAQFRLPNATAQSNIESLALFQRASHTLLVWAERGDDQVAAKIAWGDYNLQDNRLSFSPENTTDFFAPYPTENRRSISDMAIDHHGVLWVSAVSDPGDNGAFESVLYTLGQFVEGSAGIDWKPYDAPRVQAQYAHVKIEGLTFVDHHIVMGTDDENFGSSIAVKEIK